MPRMKGAITAQCTDCHKVLYDDRWLFGEMSISLPHVRQVRCPACIRKAQHVASMDKDSQQGVA